MVIDTSFGEQSPVADSTTKFEPTIDAVNYYDGEKGMEEVVVQLSHGLMMTVRDHDSSATFHFGGRAPDRIESTKELSKKSYASSKAELAKSAEDIRLGLENLRDILLKNGITLPNEVGANTHNPFLARLFRGLPNTEAVIQICWPPDRENPSWKMERVILPERDLQDFLDEIPEGVDRLVSYQYIHDISDSPDHNQAFIEVIDTVLLPRINELIQRIERTLQKSYV